MLSLDGVPLELIDLDDAGWAVHDGDLTVRARAHSDLFVDPSGGGATAAESQSNAVRLLGAAPDGDWTLSAEVSVDFAATFDAGVLLVWLDETTWAKLCFERSPQGTAMVVSVVTRGVSDDANCATIAADRVALRVAKVGGVFAFHYSLDGTVWHFVRAFSLGASRDVLRVGFEAQSPTGDGCDVRFRDARFTRHTLGDLRSGE